MKITVSNAYASGTQLHMTLGQPWRSREGERALRILYYLAGLHAYSSNGQALRLDGGGNDTRLNTTTAAQTTMDQFANRPITIRYGEVRVASTQAGISNITSMRQLRSLQEVGVKAWAQMGFSAYLPLIHEDFTRLQAALNCPVYRNSASPHVGTVVVYLQGTFAESNPWDLLGSFKPTIGKIIA